MAEQVVEGVWLLDLGLVPPLATNAYLVDDARGPLGGGDWSDRAASDGGGLTLVDAGLRWNLSSLSDEIADAGYAVPDIDRVLLTHFDIDHTGGLSSIARDLQATVHIGRADGALVDGDADPPLLHHKGLFHRVARRVAPLPDDVAVTRVEDGDRLGRFTAYHTPGHNPGHTVYVHDDGVAFLGDLVWVEDGEFTPPFWLDSYDVRTIHESIRRFAADAVPFEVACVGHGDPVLDGASRRLGDLAATL
jgi:glyoxylase-like metal-dependent hydrolase (beta-lactamase superfamily II)